MECDGVSVAFKAILKEIETVILQLNEEGAAAFGQSRYSDAERLSERGKRLAEFREKLKVLQEEWSSNIDIITRNRIKAPSGYQMPKQHKGPATNLRIALDTDRIITRTTAAQAMVDAFEAMGIERVMNLGFKVCGIPLVGAEEDEKCNQIRTGRYLVCTHSNTKSKKQMLERVAKALHFNIKVDIV